MKNISLILPILLLLVFSSCQKTKTYKDKLQVHYENLEPHEIVSRNYAKALFSADTSDFANELKKMKSEYGLFLDGNLDDNEAVKYLKSFATDTFCVRVNDMVQKSFSNLTKLNSDIKSVYQIFKYYYPEIRIPYDTYYYISGIDYGTPPVMIHPEGVLVSLDFYLGNKENIYDYIGMPRYLSIRHQEAYVARDLAQTIYYNCISGQQKRKDVLTDMINKGKELFFIEALNPALPDSVLMGYSSQQMKWAELYEGDIWSSVVGNNMLYSTDSEVARMLFGDGPFTQAFSNESPARLGEYIGLKIVRSYMTNNDVRLQDLMRNDDVQQIFQASQYKPKIKR